MRRQISFNACNQLWKADRLGEKWMSLDLQARSCLSFRHQSRRKKTAGVPCNVGSDSIYLELPRLNSTFPRKHSIPDPLHSEVEDRFVTIGTSHRGKLLVVVHTEQARIFASSVRDQRAGANKRVMKKRRQKYNEMLPEYDFSRGVRGKYVRRYAQGSNVVVLDPDVAKAFPNAEAVNSSLRSLAEIIRSQKSAAVK